jgi:tRNA pseudouridine38-40 synthase
MQNIKLIIEYDGTNYAGWQKQLNAMTVQQQIEQGLYQLTGIEIRTTGAGRTDAGVHALGQVVSFQNPSTIPPERLHLALNSVLPDDIRCISSQAVNKNFHARYDAKGKRYRYTIANQPIAPAINRHTTAHVSNKLNIENIEKAAKYLVGTHDFKAFSSIGGSAKTSVRTIYKAEIIHSAVDNTLHFVVEGNGFLYNMVRIIVGTLLEVGKENKPESIILDMIRTGDRTLGGPTAPPQGLCMEAVFYA